MPDYPYYEYRKRCIEQKGEECIICGTTSEIVIHHKDGDRENHDLDNLVPLCADHHRKVHNKHPDVEELVHELGYTPRTGEITSIQISDENWKRLHLRKSRGDSFNDVLERLLDDTQESE